VKEKTMGRQRIRLRDLLVLLILVAVLHFSTVHAYVESNGLKIMPLSSVKPGMRGVGLTVVRGTKIEEFDVEVLGVLPTDTGLKGLILVETLGPLIERSKGIAMGMSGSPVYIDGKLVGGLGYKYDEEHGSLGLVTPIEDMLEILSYPYRGNVVPALNDREDDESEMLSRFQPITAPVMVSGLSSERARRVMDAELRRLDVGPVSVGGSGQMDMSVPVEPGSSIGIQLMRGDVNAFVLGTVTYREENRILAFGHPFMHKGETSYLASGAYIHTTAASNGTPFKIASPTGIVGTMTQDRMSGIAGIMGVVPTVVPVRLSVFASDIDRTREMSVELVRDDALIPGLLLTALLNGVDSTIDRIGAGTAHVSFEITANGLDSSLRRENVFFSSSDIAVVSLTEILESVGLLLGNDFQDVEILDIKVDVTVDSARRTAVVEEIVLEDSVVEPGDVLVAKVLLRPFRGDPWVETVEIQIPGDMACGYAVLTVHGGTSYAIERSLDYETYNYDMNEIGLDSTMSADTNAKNLDAAVKAFLSRKMNNQLIISVVPYASAYDIKAVDSDDSILFADSNTVLPTVQEQNAEGDDVRSEQGNGVLEVVVSTGYVLQGWKSLEFEISTPKQCEEGDTETEEMEFLPEEIEPLGLGTLGQVDI
jgi:hypothetical protein